MKYILILLSFHFIFFACKSVSPIAQNRELKELRQEAQQKNVEANQIQLAKVDSLIIKIDNILQVQPLHPVKAYLPILISVSSQLKGLEYEINTFDLRNKETDIIKQLDLIRSEHEKYTNIIEMVHHQITDGFVHEQTNTELFGSGQFELSEAGKKIFKDYTDKLLLTVNDLANKNEIIFKISTIGYADDVAPSNTFVYLLLSKKNITTANLPNPERPYQATANRQFLNQILSELRAQSVYNEIKFNLIQNGFQENNFQGEFIGKGEEIPVHFTDNDITRDQRRIVIYSTVILPKVDN